MLCSTAIRWLSQAISGHGAYISQDNRLIFLNNSLILAKGWSARLSRRRRWDFRPARGKPAARARARAFDRREIDIQKWRKYWVFALLFPVLARKSRSTAPRIVPNPRGIDPFGARLANLTSETSSQLTPPSSEESANFRSLKPWPGKVRLVGIGERARMVSRDARTRRSTVWPRAFGSMYSSPPTARDQSGRQTPRM